MLLRNIFATSCQWLLTLQQCGSFVGKRLLVEGLFTAFNEGAASAAANQRSSKFPSVTQRLHQATRTAADQAHGNPLLLPDRRHKGLVQVPPPFRGPSQHPVVFLLQTHCSLSHLGCPTFSPLKTPCSSFLSLCDVWKVSLSSK